jgi:hypothetical protein
LPRRAISPAQLTDKDTGFPARAMDSATKYARR